MRHKLLFLFTACLLLCGCHNSKTINGVTYDVYGLANMDEKKNPNIEYEISIGSCVAAVLLSETVIVPLYVLAVDLWQPIGIKPPIVGQKS